MTSESPMLDLLVVGGLTVDRFADGSSAAGGTVLHVARAAAPRGLRVGIVTTSGPDPQAEAGLAELRSLAALVESQPHDQTTVFRHGAGPKGRRLWLDHLGGPVRLDATARQRIFTRSILYAPVIDEIPVEGLAVWPDRPRGAILQGWLRSTDAAAEVRPIPLGALSSDLVDALSQFDLLVASREDLLAESDTPDEQLAALRRTFGEWPDLVVTDGADGLSLDTRGSGAGKGLRRHVDVPRRVETESTVGAGDVLAAFLTAHIGDGRPTDDWVHDAMLVVAEVLEA